MCVSVYTLDYCNALLYGVSDRLMCHLQSVQNAAARLVTVARRCNHITPILQQLHWLPVWQRVLFKIAVLVFQCLAGQAPSYLSDDCRPVSDSRPHRLRSSDSLSCVVRCAHNTYGDRCFATAVSRVWNSLPAELQQCSSLRQFKRCLKTFLFGLWDYGALWLFVKQQRIEIVLLTYLLSMFLWQWISVCLCLFVPAYVCMRVRVCVCVCVVWGVLSKVVCTCHNSCLLQSLHIMFMMKSKTQQTRTRCAVGWVDWLIGCCHYSLGWLSGLVDWLLSLQSRFCLIFCLSVSLTPSLWSWCWLLLLNKLFSLCSWNLLINLSVSVHMQHFSIWYTDVLYQNAEHNNWLFTLPS